MDIVRAAAILMVVVSHSSVFLSPLTNSHLIGPFIHSLLNIAQPFGALGVELFFVLSGFLIGSILIRDFLDADRFSFQDVKRFWVRRWFRTLPNFWLILTVNLVLYKILKFNTIDPLKILYYFFLQNLWFPHPVYFFGEAWSLAVEEWFYLTLPIALLLSVIVFKPKNKKRFLFGVFTAYLMFFLMIRVINAIHPLYGPDQDGGIRKIVIFRLDAVMYGVLFAYWTHYYRAFIYSIKNRLLLVSFIGTAFMYYILYNDGFKDYMAAHQAVRFLSDAFMYLFIPLFFSLCLPYAGNLRSIKNTYLSAGITYISKISYSMYLVHYSLIFIPFFSRLQLTSYTAVIVLYVLYWVLVTGISTLLYKYYEYPVMKLRDKIARQ